MRLLGVVAGVGFFGVLLLAGCGAAEDDPAGSEPVSSTPTAAASGELVGYATVLENAEHGPQLCLGAVFTSLPPQCGGVPLTNWDWSAAPDAQALGEVTWADGYRVVGTYDGSTFTLTQPPTKGLRPTPPFEPGEYFKTPCEAPEGGWRPVDPDRMSRKALEHAIELANTLPAFGEVWSDQSLNPHSGATEPAEVEKYLNDPRYTILNVSVTEDLAGAESALRAVWGGPLCVSAAASTQSELLAIQREITAPGTGLNGSSVAHGGYVTLDVTYDDGTLQTEMDSRYGVGIVKVTSALQPLESE